ncbi:MAG TPA: hypothetical protein VM266_15525 [Solirubrobacteraceae bacterium]|nr:hypothetical protein [Solirubrobacteraceae bacterium]
MALLTAAALALPFAACGEDAPTAEEFCDERGGINEATLQPNGDAECMDGTKYEAAEQAASTGNGRA